MNPLNVIHVGMGGRGRAFVADAQKSEMWTPVAVVDINPERLQMTQEQLGIPESMCYRTMEEAMDDRDAQVVFNLTPPQVHGVITKKALQVGKHVFVEKPFTTCLEDAVECVQIARERNLCLVVGQQSRYSPTTQAIRHLIQTEQVGRPAFGTLVNYNYRPAPLVGVMMPHAMLLERSVHHFEDLVTVFGEPESVIAKNLNPFWSQYESGGTVEAIITFKRDVVLSYFGTLNAHKGFSEWRIGCFKGTIVSNASGLFIETRDQSDPTPVPIPPASIPPVEQVMRSFYRYITEGEEPATSGRNNLTPLGIAFAAVESSRRGREMGVEEVLQEAGYGEEGRPTPEEQRD